MSSDKLLNHRVVDGEQQFLVKGFGYAEPTWEPEASLPLAIVSRFVKRRMRSPQRTAAQKKTEIGRSSPAVRTCSALAAAPGTTCRLTHLSRLEEGGGGGGGGGGEVCPFR